MKPGESLEIGIWMDGRETEDMKRQFELDLRATLARVSDEQGVIIGPLVMRELKPGDDRVPEVPKGLQGPDVRILVGEARIVGILPEEKEGCFVADLEPKDLHRLRTILRRVHQKWNPGKPELSDEKCDEYINQNGPDAAVAALREQVGVKVN